MYEYRVLIRIGSERQVSVREIGKRKQKKAASTMAPAVGGKKRTTKQTSAVNNKRTNTKAGGGGKAGGGKEKEGGENVSSRTSDGARDKENPGQKTSFKVVARGSTTSAEQSGGIPKDIEVEGSVNVSTETTENPSREWFEKCRKNGLMSNDNWMTLDLDRYVRVDLFPTLKFFMDKKQLNYTTDETSICWQICTENELRKDKAQEWWEGKKSRIVKILNAKRNDVISAIKRNFMSK